MIEQKMATAIIHNCSDVLTVDEIKNSSNACADVAIEFAKGFAKECETFDPDQKFTYDELMERYLETLNKGKGE